MSLRHLTRQIATSVAATAAVVAAVLAVAAPAGAAISNGGQVPGAATPQAPYTAGQPFDSGQTITVSLPANSVFGPGNNTGHINIVECSAPNGVLPTNTSSCDGLTIQGDTILPATDGSFTYSAYTIYALPDSVSLGEPSSSGVHCGDTDATECVLYIGNDQTDFTKPHVWSQAFKVSANGTDAGTNPGDGTPEIQMAVILPLAALGALAAVVVVRRRRASHTHAS